MKTPSVEPVLTSRLLPRVSFRLLLALVTISALIAAIARAAGQGVALAYAFSIGLGFLAVVFLLFVLLFLISRSFTSLWYKGDADVLEGSPFAEGQLPPQILPPREQRS